MNTIVKAACSLGSYTFLCIYLTIPTISTSVLDDSVHILWLLHTSYYYYTGWQYNMWVLIIAKIGYGQQTSYTVVLKKSDKSLSKEK